MSFEHVKTEWQPSVVDKILNLDGQIANHLVDPDEVVAFVEQRLPVFKEIARTDRVYFTALERIELAKAVGGVPSAQARARRDRLRRPDRARGAGRDRAPRDRRRSTATGSPRCCSTSTRTPTSPRPSSCARCSRGGHPVTAVGDPDQNIYAWRGASLSNLFDFPTDFPKADGSPAERLPLFTNFRSGARILHAADTIIAPLPAAQRPDPDKRLVPFGPNGEGEVTVTSHRDELTEARAIAERVMALHEGAHAAEGVVPTGSGSSWSEIAVLCRTSRLFFLLQQTFAEREHPGRDRWARRPVAHARGRRGHGVRARSQRRDGERGARPHPHGPPLPGRLQGPRARRLAGPRARTTPGVTRAATTRRRRSCSPRRSSISTRSRGSATRAARDSRSSAPSCRPCASTRAGPCRSSSAR